MGCVRAPPRRNRRSRARAASSLQRRAGVERDAGARELGGGVATLRTPDARARNASTIALVLLGQHAARRVDEPAAGLHERRRRGEDRVPASRRARRASTRRLPPLEIGIAAQRAEAGARRVDEHAVDLAGEPLDLRVALVRDQLRMHVRQPRAREPRLQVREPSRRRRRTRTGGPASASCAPSSSVLPPAPAQKSTTMSLRRGATSTPTSWLPSSCTSIAPVDDPRMRRQRRPPVDANAVRRVGRRDVASRPSAASAASASSRDASSAR